VIGEKRVGGRREESLAGCFRLIDLIEVGYERTVLLDAEDQKIGSRISSDLLVESLELETDRGA
jgi:hypothetical protein